MTETGSEAVLIPAGASPDVLTCIRSLAPRGVRTIIASEHESLPAFSSRYCNEAITVPSPHEDLLAYKDTLLSLAARSAVRTIVPSREEDAYLLSKYRTEFAEHIVPLWPTADGIRSAQDRVRLIEAAGEAGVPVPETWLLDEVPDWNRELIVKPRYSILASEYVDGLSPTQCEGKLDPIYLLSGSEPDRDEVRARMHENCRYDVGHVPIVQELVGNGAESNEYSFTALYDRGDAVATFQHYQRRGKTYAGGASACRESIQDPRLEKVGRRLLDSLEWHGLVEIEFLGDEATGEFKLMEVNPRLWASLRCGVGAGVDFPYYYWSLAGEIPLRVEAEYEIGFVSHSLLGELQYLWSVLREDHPSVEQPAFRSAVRAVASSCYTQPHFDYLSLDDPYPFVRGVLNALPIDI